MKTDKNCGASGLEIACPFCGCRHGGHSAISTLPAVLSPVPLSFALSA